MKTWQNFITTQDAAKDVDKPHEELLKSCEAQRAKVPASEGSFFSYLEDHPS